MDISTKLRGIQDEILAHARKAGLDPFQTIFELIDFDEINEVASYGGFPTRYPHWRFGMEYESLQKGYVYGLQKIYELVINNDPCYAYLMKSNSLVDQKMVIAHVYGHSDFFKNNLWFSQTNRKMIDAMANHGTRVRKHIERHGEETVEKFVECALSIEHLIDYHSVYSPYRKRKEYNFFEEDDSPSAEIPKLKSKDYMDKYINPPDLIKKQRQKMDEIAKAKKRFPAEPEKDILKFLIEEAPIENWQKDVISIVREESYYFAPQALSKIMNEGWASFWHSKLMTEKCLAPNELVDYADHHSGTMGMSPGTINPYKLGIELFRDIEDRWNHGRFGKEYDECDDSRAKATWDLHLNKGMEKVFEVRKIYNDITFIDDFMTADFCERHKLFVYRHNPQTNMYEIADRDPQAIKRQLLTRLTNMGHPLIYVEDGNFRNRSELLLRHQHEGYDIDLAEARDTLANVYRIWQRPVNLATQVEGAGKLLTFDGSAHREEETDDVESS